MRSVSAAVKVAITPFRSERALHICVLCAFTFSEPLFYALSQQLVFLHDLDVGWGEIGYVLAVLTFGIPIGWILLDWSVMAAAGRWGGRGRNLVLGLLIFLLWLTLLRPFMRFRYLEDRASIWLVTALIAVAATVLSVQLYLRFQWVRHWMTVASIGVIFVPGLFLYRFGSVNHQQPQPITGHVEHPVPVVLIVFDEFSGTTLMDRNLEIDAQRFPQFARLAKMSTWYRQASTVHVRTDKAVPAILSGRLPEEGPMVLEAQFPGNLLQLIHGTGAYEMTVFEPITRLCPKGVRRRMRVARTHTKKLSILTRTLWALYPHLILPRDTPMELPPVSRLWFGLVESDENARFLYTQNVLGLRQMAPFTLRDEQLRKFIAGVFESDKPPFRFLHVELPHTPWSFLPSGRQYNHDEDDAFRPTGAWGDLGEDWGTDPNPILRNEHRYLLQAGYVDRFIGQLLDRLNDTQLLDRCLLIVTADHGISFRPGHSRRIPDRENVPEIVSVPLFIKMPGQQEGATSNINVESIDILPTIAEVLGLALTEPVDGIPVSRPTRRARKSIYFDEGMMVLEPTIPRLEMAVARRWDIFGADSLDRPPLAACSRPDWIGRPTAEFTIFDQPLKSLKIEPPVRTENSGVCEFVPSLVWGTLDTHELQRPIGELALAVDGVIVDASTTYGRRHTVHGFEFLLPESIARQKGRNVELFQVEEGKPPRLRRLKKWTLGEHP